MKKNTKIKLLYRENPRIKPVYKKILRLRHHIFYSEKIFKFKKQKWRKFVYFAKAPFFNKFKKYRIFDHNKHVLTKYLDYFKNQYRYKLYVKKGLETFYGGLTKEFMKKVIESSTTNYQVLELIESRLDVVLFRACFVSSIKSARQIIKNKHVFVNNKITNSSSFILKSGDFIKISDKYTITTKESILKHSFWPFPPNHLQINFVTFQIIFIGDFNYFNFYFIYPFWVDLNTLVTSYKY